MNELYLAFNTLHLRIGMRLCNSRCNCSCTDTQQPTCPIAVRCCRVVVGVHPHHKTPRKGLLHAPHRTSASSLKASLRVEVVLPSPRPPTPTTSSRPASSACATSFSHITTKSGGPASKNQRKTRTTRCVRTRDKRRRPARGIPGTDCHLQKEKFRRVKGNTTAAFHETEAAI